MKKFHFLYYLCFFFFVAACNKEDSIEKYPTIVNKYDPALPVSADRLMPTYGGIDQTFVIEGNFKGDLSNMRVYFGKKKAILIATDGHSISGLVPKQLPGNNSVSVVVGKDSLAPASFLFKYKQSKSVKTIAGKYGDGKTTDGDLDAARFERTDYVATVKGLKGDNIVVVQTEWASKVRLISLDDNKVLTIGDGQAVSKPAVTSTRDKFYVITHWPDQHRIYSFSRAENWTMQLTGITIAQADMPGQIFGCTFGNDDRYLYAMDNDGRLACVDLEKKSYQMISIVGEPVNNWGDWSGAIVYSKFHDCFFACFSNNPGVFKIYNDNGTWRRVKYAGFNGAGAVFGDRLKDAKFTNPHGLAVTDDGEIYVVCKNHYICKITGDQVELVAGKNGNYGDINGNPLDARFDQPRDIAIDFEGNFFIAAGEGKSIKKLSIE
ncbi:MAG: hypothetical protein Q8928_08370 [Bacteroidota bacterium]|nr:hypothetical protein [Bacteroidota bacterium]